MHGDGEVAMAQYAMRLDLLVEHIDSATAFKHVVDALNAAGGVKVLDFEIEPTSKPDPDEDADMDADEAQG